MKVRARKPFGSTLLSFPSVVTAMMCSLLLLFAGCGSVHSGSNEPTVTIAAAPTSIKAGASSTLTVTAGNATTVSITGSDGSSYNLAAAGGTQSVKPATTTTYTATASSSSGKATATATVTVAAAPANPTVTVTADPTTITAGSSSTLTIHTTNATVATVTGTDGSSYTVQLTNGNGTQAVSPAATTTYTVTATGATGTTPGTATATVTVEAAPPPPPAPTVRITADPASISPGGSSTLTVAETNATSLVIVGSDGTSPTVPVTGGTVSVKPAQTTTYTVTATNATGTAEATATVKVNQGPTPKIVTFNASPSSIAQGSSSTLTVTTQNATSVTVTGSDSSTNTITIDNTNAGTLQVTPAATATYTAIAHGQGGDSPSATTTVTVVPPGSLKSINHVIFMLQENHAFDNYFGMLNPYRKDHGYNMGTDGTEYDVDGLVNPDGSEDKRNGQAYDAMRGSTVIANKDKQGGSHPLYSLKSSCLDDMSSAWSESFGDVALGNYLTTRTMNNGIKMNGYASNGDGFANSKCPGGVGPCTGYSDTTGDRTMGYYDDSYLNYYYYMASQFALSDRWFSPIESKSIPNRIATFTGGTTQGLTRDPGLDDHLPQLNIKTIFEKLDKAGVSWKVYYTVNNGECDPEDCNKSLSGSDLLPATTFSSLTYYNKFLYRNASAPDPSGCTGVTSPSSVVGDSKNTFCIDLSHIAPVTDNINHKYGYFDDLKNGTLPSFAFIESGSGRNDEHPGYQQSVLIGQKYVASIINALMNSTSWDNSVFFLAYDEGGGPYDHVPPVPGHTNDFTDTTQAGSYPKDVSDISIQADGFYPCVPAAAGDLHCDLQAGQPGSNPGDAAGPNTNTPPGSGFGAQLGFRVPNIVVSPFVKKHYVSHVPMDHTAIIKFVEDRFIGDGSYLTKRDAAQPNLLDFFDFAGVPWATPPTQTSTPPPTPNPNIDSTCKPTAFH